MESELRVVRAELRDLIDRRGRPGGLLPEEQARYDELCRVEADLLQARLDVAS